MKELDIKEKESTLNEKNKIVGGIIVGIVIVAFLVILSVVAIKILGNNYELLYKVLNSFY